MFLRKQKERTFFTLGMWAELKLSLANTHVSYRRTAHVLRMVRKKESYRPVKCIIISHHWSPALLLSSLLEIQYYLFFKDKEIRGSGIIHRQLVTLRPKLSQFSLFTLSDWLLLLSHFSLCDPIDGSPQGSPIPGILQARTLEWVAISSTRYLFQSWPMK